jgi:hypothetical protein
MKLIKNIFIFWIVIMLLVTFTCLLTYVVAQQVIRLGANELPVQLATETSIKIENGQSAKDAVPDETIDISKSLGTFVMIFDKDKNLIATSALMGNTEPDYVKGVLDYVDKKGEYRVTWQPQVGLRFATIATKIGDKYIVGGRSLQEPERLIDTIGKLVSLTWLVCVAFSSIALGITYIFIKKYSKRKLVDVIY